MYKHILIPTDGSETSDKAVDEGLKFAKAIGAKVTLFTARPEWRTPNVADAVARRIVPLEEFERRAMEEANALLARVAERARAAGVEAHSAATLSDRPWEAIIKAAEKHGCDLIFIASHGRKGFSGFVHGSETHEVLTHSKIPALVVR